MPSSSYFISLFLLTTACFVVQTTTTVVYQSENDTLRNMLVLTDNTVLVGSANNIYKLSPELTVERFVSILEENRMLLHIQSSLGNVLSCLESDCFLYNSETLTYVTAPGLPNTILSANNKDIMGISVTNSEFFVGSENSPPSLSASISKVGYTSSSNSLNLNLVGRIQESSAFNIRTYLAGFEYSNFVYYVFGLPSNGNNLQIARICTDDPGFLDFTLVLRTYTEAQLECPFQTDATNIVGTSAEFFLHDGEPTVVISFRNGMDNGICSYNITDINIKMDNKLDECKQAIGLTNLKRSGTSICLTLPNPDAITPCNRAGSIVVPLEVDNPTQGAVVNMSKSTFPYKSMGSLQYEDTLYLFMGNNGTIEQFYFTPDNSLIYIRDIPINASLNIDEIHFTNDSQWLYALTTSSIIKHQINVCGELKSCDLCLSSLDPICGWCTLSSTCTKQSECTTSPQVWQVSTGTSQGRCPSIDTVDPSAVYTDQLVSPLPSVSMNISNVPGVDYTCVYQFDDTSITTTSSATLDGNETVTCPLPHNSELPPIVDGIIYATISLKTTSDVFIVSLTDQQKIAITNCTMKTSCLSCLNLAQACNWCPFDNKCVSPLQNCANPLGGTGAEMCPLIQPPDRADTSDYLLHASIPQSLMIRAINIGIFDISLFNISCIIKHANGTSIYRLNGLWNETSSVIVCSEDMFNVTLNSTHLFESLLNVEITNANSAISIENFMNSKVVFYSCPLMGENCGQCLSIESKFQCGYCLASQACIQSTLISCDSPNILEEITDITMCETPIIYTFSPTAGPVSGETIVEINGRNLAANVSQIMSISILTETCTHLPNMYIPGKRVVCKTQKTNTGIVEAKIVIEFTYDQSVSSAESYRFLIVSLDNPAANPAIGPVSGGTIVTLSGSHLGIGNHRSISLAGQDCEILNPENIMVNDTNITCITQRSATTTNLGNGAILLIVDSNPLYRTGFDYLSDPEFTGIRPQNFFNSGGTDFTIEGKNFHTITNPRMLFYISFDASETIITKNMSCEHSSSDNNVITCKAPSLDFNDTQIRSATVEFGFQMDNVIQMRKIDNHTLNIYDDPTFVKGIEEQLEPGNERNITIMGSGFYFSDVQVVVTVGSLNCKIQNLTDKALTCLLEVPITQENGNYPITVQVGSRSWEVGTLEIRRPLEIYVYLAPIIAAIFVVFIVFFIIILSVFYRKYKQKDEQNDRLILELEKLEYNVAHECKLGFAELQTDLDELTGDITGTRLPYHDLTNYLLQSLFPGAKDHPTLHPPVVSAMNQARVEMGIKQFRTLISDKTVLLCIIHSLESQRQFTIRDKSTVGSLLMIALHDRLDYATDILKRLLSELVRKTIAESYPKLLLRRTESLAEKMLSSWLAFTLHEFVTEHTGQPLYLLFKAVKAQLEKGPIDVITGEARYSLSEQKLIRQQLDVQVINATVESPDTEDGLQIPVKLLNCDSISQAKEKMLDTVYKNVPVSQRPQLTAIDIEYRKSPTQCVILRDEDGSNMVEYGWRRINTLDHYNITDRAIFRLVPRPEKSEPGTIFDYTGSLMVSHGHRTRTLSDGDDGMRMWHLFKQVDEDPNSSPFMSKKMVTEIYLPRMLSTKTILQQFVDDLFNSIFTLSHPPISPTNFPQTPTVNSFQLKSTLYAPGSESLPLPIKYIFDFLDNEALNAKISDPDVVHTWKNNSLALRFWVNLIKNPEFVFDINKSAIVDSCLSVIAQAFIDGCSSSDNKPTINSPTSKLLYNKEVQGYKNSVKFYYEKIQELPMIPEDMMMQHLRELSTHQAQLFKKSQQTFNIDSAVFEILRYAIKYQEAILQGLRISGLESKAQIFESIVHCVL